MQMNITHVLLFLSTQGSPHKIIIKIDHFCIRLLAPKDKRRHEWANICTEKSENLRKESKKLV